MPRPPWKRPLRNGVVLMLAMLVTALSVSAPAASEVTVTAEDLQRDIFGGWIASGLSLPEPSPETPAVDPNTNDAALALLRSLIARGQAHGFEGMLYDNRDRGHSRLNPALFPSLTHLYYDPQLMEQQADYGLAGLIQYPAIVLGNSSTALTSGPSARSQSRFGMTVGGAPAMSARLYLNNHLYVYPEHRDYDAVDLFPANWPYHVISKGSSRSDRPFLRALAATLGAFPSDTLEALQSQGLVAPTLQMILRRNLAFVRSEESYYSGAPHRPVLSGSDLRPTRMVAHANALRPEDLPPLVRLSVQSESFGDAAGLGRLSEKLFTTPAAISRIWRGFSWEQTMIVSAADTRDPNGRDLAFRWQLLQGDAGKVSITPLDAAGTRARITVQWHDSFALPSSDPETETPRRTSRVDIGVFADNGQMPSAPALISIAFPTHQNRLYATTEETGQTSRLERIDYDALGRGVSFDPLLYWSAAWVDEALYDFQGRLTGWQRRYATPERADASVPFQEEASNYGFEQINGYMVLSDQAKPEGAGENP